MLGRCVSIELSLSAVRLPYSSLSAANLDTCPLPLDNRVFDTMPRDVKDQCVGFRARPRFTPGFRGLLVSQIVWLGVKDVFTQIAKDVVGQGLGHDLRTQMPRHAVRRVLQTTIKAATSPRAELGPGPSLRTLLQTTIRTPKTSDFQAGLFPSFWTGTSDYITRIEFTTACQDAPGVLSLDVGQPRTVTHGRSAYVPYPREDGGTTICDTHADVPSARRLGEQLAFKDSMVHGILQFTPSIAFCYVLHRWESRDIHCQEGLVISGSYAYDPTKTEVLGMDERITTESAGTIRNRPTESDVSSFSGRSVSRMVNHPRHRDPNTSPDHSIGRSDGQCVQRAGT
ncbi:hypothetical protein YC2023_066347 [Brassica napus]